MEYPVHTFRQLAQTLQGRRKSKKLTQKEAGESVGLLPKTVSALESAPGRCSLESLFKALSALDLELVLRPKTPPSTGGAAAPGARPGAKPKPRLPAGEW